MCVRVPSACMRAHTQMGGAGGGMMGDGMPGTGRSDMRIGTSGADWRVGLADYASARLKDEEVRASSKVAVKQQ
jgi:hypothetical protein